MNKSYLEEKTYYMDCKLPRGLRLNDIFNKTRITLNGNKKKISLKHF